jgi:hypothetical protein
MDHEPLTRRALARLLAGTALIASAPAVIGNRGASTGANALVAVLARFREDVLAAFRASELETLARVAHATASRLGASTLDAAAARIVGRRLDEIGSHAHARELHALVARNIRADYAAGRIESVAGWLLSRTELLIVAQTLRKPIGR